MVAWCEFISVFDPRVQGQETMNNGSKSGYYADHLPLPAGGCVVATEHCHPHAPMQMSPVRQGDILTLPLSRDPTAEQRHEIHPFYSPAFPAGILKKRPAENLGKPCLRI